MAKNNWISTASNDYGVAGNWSDGVPNSSDDVALEHSSIDIGANLDQSSVDLTSFIQYDSYTGRSGVHPLSSAPGTAGTYLQIDAGSVVLGRRHGPVSHPGSPRMMIDIGGTTTCAMVVESTARAASEAGLPPVRIKGNKTAHTLEVRQGHVGVAVGRTDETSTFGTITFGRAGGRLVDTHGVLGPGVTINTKVNVRSGMVYLHNAVPSIDASGGVTYHNGTGAVSGTVTVFPGAIYIPTTTGTINAVTIKRGGRVDLSQSSAAREITTITYDDPRDLIDNPAVSGTRSLTVSQGGTAGMGGGF